MRSERAYRDPTGDTAVGMVMKELKKKTKISEYSDEPVARKRQVVPSWKKELNKIEENSHA